jgi:hypothetical protein
MIILPPDAVAQAEDAVFATQVKGLLRASEIWKDRIFINTARFGMRGEFARFFAALRMTDSNREGHLDLIGGRGSIDHGITGGRDRFGIRGMGMGGGVSRLSLRGFLSRWRSLGMTRVKGEVAQR